MASIVRETTVDLSPELVWDAIRDVGAVHTRLAPGFVTDTKMEEGARVVTFHNGLVARELIVTVDDAAKRLVWAVVGTRLTHHNASLQVFRKRRLQPRGVDRGPAAQRSCRHGHGDDRGQHACYEADLGKPENISMPAAVQSKATAMSRRPAKAEAQERLLTHYCVFDSGFGPVGIAWSAKGVCRLQLPEATLAATERRLLGRGSEAVQSKPPPEIERVVVDVRRYFAGERVEFSDAQLDLSGVSTFHGKIYEAALRVGWGETTTYGALAKAAGFPDAARAVGQAMGRNPIPLIIPCHRVLASGGKPGGFSAFGGTVTKDRMLAREGVCLGSGAPRIPGL
jgi:methylated-DNA-[protein]-cysteine S-methyltransferase